MPQEVTVLSPEEERQFKSWAARNQITDVDHPQSFYDYRGFWKETKGQSVRFGTDHFPDTYKQHGHPTFSVESKYSRGPNDGGRWVGERFVPQSESSSLASQIRKKYPGVYDDLNDKDLEKKVLAKYPQYKDLLQKPSLSTRTLDFIERSLPTVGGIAGGLAGSPGGPVTAAGGAMLGAAGGEAWRQNMRRFRGKDAPSTPLDAAAGIAKESLVSGVAPQVGGQVIGAAAKIPAKLVTRGALGRVPAKVLESFDTSTAKIVKTLLDRGIPVSEGGATKLGSIVNRSSAALKRRLAQIPADIDPKQSAQVFQNIRKHFLAPGDQAAIDAVEQGFLKHPSYGVPTQTGTKTVSTGILNAQGQPITRAVPVIEKVTPKMQLAQAHKWKQNLYKQLGATNYMKFGTAENAAEKGAAGFLKSEIEKEAQRAGVDVRTANQAIQQVMAAQSAVKHALQAPAHESILTVVQHPVMFLAEVVQRTPAARRFIQLGLYAQAGRIAKVSPVLLRIADQSLLGRNQEESQ